jgi:hypothetical protein
MAELLAVGCKVFPVPDMFVLLACPKEEDTSDGPDRVSTANSAAWTEKMERFMPSPKLTQHSLGATGK